MTSLSMTDKGGKLLQYRSPRVESEWTAKIGMIIFLASWGMMFAALFFTYGGVRLQAPIWPPVQYPALPVALPSINTGLVLGSSALLHVGIRSLRDGHGARLGAATLLAATMGTAFLGLQLVVWMGMHRAGLTPASGTYGSVFFGLTWVHAAHVLIGLVALFVLAFKAFRGAYTPARHLSVRLWAMYWHFVGVVWAVLYLTVYVF